jgi:dipeptide/tripeptide permease
VCGAMTKHPAGLFRLFFIEMWERFSFYVIGWILLLYAQDTEKGGLGLSSFEANEIVGTYLAMVYFMPFVGGLLADRFLGYRRSVALGGLVMAAGLFLLAEPGFPCFVAGLACVCIGNGFFKPNISVMVGHLYEKGDPRRDSGFNIFYMGINIGALAASFAATWMRNEHGWGWTYRMAGFGLLLGVAILAISWRALARADRPPERSPDDMSVASIFGRVLLPTFAIGIAGYLVAEHALPPIKGLSAPVIGFLFGALVVIGFFVLLGRRASAEERPGLLALLPIYVAGGTFFMILHLNTTALTTWAESYTDRYSANVFDVIPGTRQNATPSYFANAAPEVPRPREETLLEVDDRTALLFGLQRFDESTLAAVTAAHPDLRSVVVSGRVAGREADPAAARYEGNGVNVYADGVVKIETSREGRITTDVPPGATPNGRVALLRSVDETDLAVTLVNQKTRTEVYAQASAARLPLGESLEVTDTVMFQSANAFCVIAFTPLVVWFFQRRAARGRAVPTARKLLYGLLLTAASMGLMVGAGWFSAGGAAKVSMLWLLLAYAIVTLGELCLSPIGLSLVTKLSPKRLVGLMMGGWFVATAFGNKLSGFFGGIQELVTPTMFFTVLTGCVLLVALFIRLVLPSLDAAIRKYGA